MLDDLELVLTTQIKMSFPGNILSFRCPWLELSENALLPIRYGRPDATDSEVIEAADFANCRDFVKALPHGFATIVGDRGVQLSGGQHQRIAIARAFLKDAPLLLLDEAPSALDCESEEAIQEAAAKLMRGRTVIAIVHRLSTVHNFGCIVVLRDGPVVQDGPPDQLMHQEGIYRDAPPQQISRLLARGRCKRHPRGCIEIFSFIPRLSRHARYLDSGHVSI